MSVRYCQAWVSYGVRVAVPRMAPAIFHDITMYSHNVKSRQGMFCRKWVVVFSMINFVVQVRCVWVVVRSISVRAWERFATWDDGRHHAESRRCYTRR
jgi:hypothetical protein